ncbi:hypothetical protein Lal_00008570 [Lupinus albus]|nr:hypothetical protein Lal_00008570 [Lupinus albus]
MVRTLVSAASSFLKENTIYINFSNKLSQHQLIFKPELRSLDFPFAPRDTYKLDIKVVHQHGSGMFVLWDRQCADIIGISTSKLRNQMVAEGEDDSMAFPLTLDMLLGRTMALRVKGSTSEELKGKCHVNDIFQYNM